MTNQKEGEVVEQEKTRKRKHGIFKQANRSLQKKRRQTEENEGGKKIEARPFGEVGKNQDDRVMKEMRRVSNDLFTKMDYGCAGSLSESFSQGSYSPLHPSLQEISPLLSHFFSESLFGDGVWTIFKLWLESNAAFAQHRFSCCYSASLSAITLLSERGSTTPMIFSASSVSESGKERRIPTENLKSLFLVRKKILLAHFQSLCLLSRFSQDMEPTTSPATIIKITSTILDSFPLPLAPSSMGGSGTGGICVYGDFEMGMKILHLLLNFVNSLPKVNLSHQDSDQEEEEEEDFITPFEKRKMLVFLLTKLRGYCEWFFCRACNRDNVPPYLADTINNSPTDFSEKRITELLRGCTSLLSFSIKALMRDALKREGEHIKFGSDLVSTVTSVLRSLGVVMFGEGDEVGGLLVVSECVEMRKVMGPRKVYVQGVVLRSFLELLSLKGESGGEDISRDATFSQCLDALKQVEQEDWVASLIISHIRLRCSDWKEADAILEQTWKLLEFGVMNLSYSPYNLNAFNLDSLRWFVQSMRGLCKKMIGDYPSALKMISSSLQNASPSDIGGHLLSMFNLSVLYKHCGEDDASSSTLSSYNKIRQANGSLSFCSCIQPQTCVEVTQTSSTPQLVLMTSCATCAIRDAGLDGVVQYELGGSDLVQGNAVDAVHRFDRFMELMRMASSGHTPSSSFSSSVPSKTFHFVSEHDFLRRMCYGLLESGEYERCQQIIEDSLLYREDFALLMYLSDSFYHLGQNEVALSHLDKALTLVCTETKEKRESEKKSLWFSSPQTAQAAVGALNNRAILLSRLGNLSGAFDSLKMALSCSPSPNEAIYYNFCSLLSHHGYMQEASAVWLKFRGFDLGKKQTGYFKREYDLVSQRLKKKGGGEEEKKYLSFDCSLLQIWALQLGGP